MVKFFLFLFIFNICFLNAKLITKQYIKDSSISYKSSKESKIRNLNMNKKLNSNKNLIISTISNYKWKDMAIFFKSYEKAGFKNCDFVVFVSNINGQTLNKIKSCGIIIHPIP